MKEKATVHPQGVRAYGSKSGAFLITCLFFFLHSNAWGQCSIENQPFTPGEKVEYALYFKWGFLMPRAGHATLDYSKIQEYDTAEYRYRLLFRTTGLFESVYKMRDTLACYFNENMVLQRGVKHSDEGGYYSIDRLTFAYEGKKVSTHSLRYTPSRIRIDTTLTTQGCAFDLMGTVVYLRSLDYTEMKTGDRFSFKVMIGRDVVNVKFNYKGQTILERDNVKFKTLLFAIDIYDDAFEHNESAAEIWIGDDENRIPVKIRAKLKLGAGEAYYSTSSGLKYPLTCRIEMPKDRK